MIRNENRRVGRSPGERRFIVNRGAQALRYRDIQTALDELTLAAERADYGRMEVMAERYATVVVTFARDRVDVARAFFLSAAFAVLRQFERQYPIRQDALEQIADDLARRIEAPAEPIPLVQSFGMALTRLATIGARAQGPKLLRFEVALHYLRRNFAVNLRLDDVARKSGFSAPTFIRMFRKLAGTTYLKFVRERRVECAKALLSTTNLTIEQIAVSSGFRSSHNLIRSFRMASGRTPGEFRRSLQRRPGATPGA